MEYYINQLRVQGNKSRECVLEKLIDKFMKKEDADV